MVDMSITRRSLIAAAGVAVGAALASAHLAPAAHADAPAGSECDIVVVGAGIAGMAAARSAAEAGAKVILVEKDTRIGALISTSPGGLTIAQVPEAEQYWQFESEVPDTMVDFLSRWDAQTNLGHRDVEWPDYGRIESLFLVSCETIDWAHQMEVNFSQFATKEAAGMDRVRVDNSAEPETLGGALLVRAFEATLAELGVEVRCSTPATALVIEDGVVCGVEVGGDAPDTIRAKAVILATGGYGMNEEYMARFVPEAAECGFQYLGGTLNSGDGMDMALEAGAALYEDGWVIPFYTLPSKALTDANPSFAGLNMYASPAASPATKLMVDAAGARLMNEAAGVNDLIVTMTDAGRAPYYVLYDASDADIAAICESGLETGEAFKADTIDELAAAAGTDGLAETFAAYQDACATGTDIAFGKAADSLVAYAEEGPYYLVRFVNSFVATMGGVKTDANCQAVDEAGEAIPGLFCIGELTHRFLYNRSMVGTCSNSAGLIMGRVVGEAVAESMA